jgi:arylsulfatase A-like enzyme
VLLLVIEDCSPRRVGYYGNTVCRTPRLDQFARDAVRFAKAHTLPPCSPSRAARRSLVSIR